MVGALALVTRAWAYLDPRQLLAARELDDATMYSVAVQLVHGNLPYRDVLYLHPPGMPLAMAPLAWLAGSVGDSHALAVARVVTVLVGVVSTVLVGVLLRDRGRVAVLVGAGLYATWVPVVRTERVALLEPVLTVCLLLALLALRAGRGARLRPATTAPLVAGALLGLALTFKVWAVVPLVVLGAVVLATRGWRSATWFVGGALVVVAAVVGPFAALAGSAMWHDVVSAQASRPPTVGSLMVRLRRFDPLDGFGANVVTDVLARVVAAAVLVGLVVVVVRGVRAWWRAGRLAAARRAVGGSAPSAGAAGPDVEVTTWALLALGQTGLVLVAPSFFYHYAAFPAPSLALLAGAGGAVAWSRWSRLSGRPERATSPAPAAAGAVDAVPRPPRPTVRRPRVAAGAGAVVLAAFAVSACVPTKPAQPSNAWLVSWAAQHRCVWGLASAVVRADAATPNADHGCDVPPDVYGEALQAASASGLAVTGTVLDDNPAWTAQMLRQVAGADGVFLPLPQDGSWLRGESLRQFDAQFEYVTTSDPFQVWQRRG